MTVALWCLFFAAFLHMLSKMPLAKAQNDAGGYDNANPREQQEGLHGWGKRALAAHQNQIESFPLFAAGVIVASAFGANPDTANALAIAYCVARVAYLFFYLSNINVLRSVVWAVGFFASLALLCSPAWSL